MALTTINLWRHGWLCHFNKLVLYAYHAKYAINTQNLFIMYFIPISLDFDYSKCVCLNFKQYNSSEISIKYITNRLRAIVFACFSWARLNSKILLELKMILSHCPLTTLHYFWHPQFFICRMLWKFWPMIYCPGMVEGIGLVMYNNVKVLVWRI